MTEIGVALDQAELMHAEGRFAEAEAIYRAVLAADPSEPRALHLFGVLAHQVGRDDIARPVLEQAVALAPHLAGPRAALGDSLRVTGNLAAAEGAYRAALERDTTWVSALNNLALLLGARDPRGEAVDLIETARALRPDLAELHNSRGYLANLAGDSATARTALEQAVALKPDYGEAWNNLGLARQRGGDLAGARAAFAVALTHPSVGGAVANNLGSLELAEGNLSAAVEAYRRAVEAAPMQVGFLVNLGTALKQQGAADAAIEAFDRALTLAPEMTAIALKRLLVMPPITESGEMIDRRRRALVDGLDRLEAAGARLADPMSELGETPFYLAYQGRNDLAPLRRLTGFLARACPGLTDDLSRSPARRPPPAGGRIRVGFLSRFLRAHTIGKLYAGVIERLPRDRFEVVLLRFSGPADTMALRLDAAADRIVGLDDGTPEARARVAAEGLDILFYPEIGMDPATWYLAFARLAPVQMVGWGHPVTTGIPAIDWFVSGAGWEAPDPGSRYSERVAEIAGPGLWYPKPKVDPSIGRAELGLPEDRRLYACPQSLFKFHPDFDPALRALLDGDPEGALVMVESPDPAWTDALRRRFAVNLGAAAERVIWLPRLPEPKFIALYRVAEVALDPPFFGSGNTTLEAFAAGTPVVTCPDEHLRTRLTAGFWRHMGIADAPIAANLAEYVTLAHRIARDPDYRRDLSNRMLERVDLLFGQDRVIDDYARLFSAVVGR